MINKTVLTGAVAPVFFVGVASAALRGGVTLTNDEWNAAASAAIGEPVTVTRMYVLFDEADDTLLLSGFDRRDTAELSYIRTRAESSLYQDAFGGDGVNNINESAFEFVPSVQWDSYLTVGTVVRTPPFTGYQNIGPIIFEDDGATLSPTGFDDGVWAITPVPNPDGAGAIYAGTAGNEYNLYDGETGLYGVMIAQMTVLGEHEEFTSVAQAGVESGRFSSLLFQGGAVVHWNESLGAPVERDELFFTVPAPGAAGLAAIAVGVVARRRR